MKKTVRRLPVTPLAVPVQLVLGLDGVGIKPARAKRRKPIWLRPVDTKAA